MHINRQAGILNILLILYHETQLGVSYNYRSELRVQSKTYRVQSTEYRAHCTEYSVQSTEYKSEEYRVQTTIMQSTEYNSTEYKSED